MGTPLFDPPEIHTLPVSWHGDLNVDFENYDPDDAGQTPPVWTPLDYEDGVIAYLDLKTDPPQRFTADISGYHAVVTVQSTVTDALKTGTLWAFLLSYPTSPTREVVVVNGQIERFDGKAA